MTVPGFRDHPEGVRRANAWLAEPGTLGLRGRTPGRVQRLRIVRAGDCREFRPGPHYTVDPNTDLVTAVEEGWQLVPKYAGCHEPEQWLFERWFGDAPGRCELAFAAGNRGHPDFGYEAVYAWPAGVVPNRLAAEIVYRALPETRRLRGLPKYSARHMEELARQRRQRDAWLRDLLENETPWLARQMADGEAVFLDATKRKDSHESHDLQPGADGDRPPPRRPDPGARPDPGLGRGAAQPPRP